MYISEQLLNPSERRLRLSTQLGVQRVVLDNRGSELVSAQGGMTLWDAAKLRDYRRWGVGYPGNQEEGGSASTELCGQKRARELPPAAEQAGVNLTCHPHDPAYPVSELGDGRERFMAFALGYARGLLQAAGVAPRAPSTAPA